MNPANLHLDENVKIVLNLDEGWNPDHSLYGPYYENFQLVLKSKEEASSILTFEGDIVTDYENHWWHYRFKLRWNLLKNLLEVCDAYARSPSWSTSIGFLEDREETYEIYSQLPDRLASLFENVSAENLA